MSWREKQSAVDILVSMPHTPQIPNGPHDMQLEPNILKPAHVRKNERRREGEVKLGFHCSCVEVEEMEEVRQEEAWGSCVCASCWKFEDSD